jgi:hypothetical protein
MMLKVTAGLVMRAGLEGEESREIVEGFRKILTARVARER